VADVTPLPGVIEQLKAVAGLRWLILKNGMRRKNNRWDLIGMIVAGVFSGLLVIGLCFAFYAGAYAFLGKGRPSWMALLFWAIFLYWQLIPVFVAGFGASFEFKSLLRFPLNPRTFYILGLGYGLADFGAISSVLWIFAMLAGTAAARPSALPVMLAVCIVFVFLNLTIERLLGSWLEKILARRKTREIFLGVFVLSMVSLNFLNPVLQRYGSSTRPKIMEWIPYLSWLPGSLAGQAVAGGATGDLRNLWTGVLGLLGWLAVASVFLWNRYAAQFRGEELGESGAPSKVVRKSLPRESGDLWPAFVPPAAAAVAAKEFRYMTRNGLFSFFTLFLPPIMVIFFTLQFAGKHSALKNHGISPEWFFPGIMAYLILILLSPAYNSFAFEGKGIQTYYLAPIRFRDVLLGKNLFLALVVGVELAVSLTVLALRIGSPTVPRLASTLAAGFFAVTGQFAIANWSALSFPKKMEIGKMRGQRNSGVAVWIAFGVQFLIGGVCSVILLAGKWTGNPWLPFIAFAGLTVASIAGYFASLSSFDELAETKKELLIETLCR
jgi:ABC-2 type transport system permease protein